MKNKAETIVISIIVVLIIICLVPIVFLFFVASGNESADLNNVEDITKEEIIELMNLEDISNDVNLIKVENPDLYRDIYYKIYFSINNTESLNNNINNSILEEIAKDDDVYGRDFENINNNEYCCTIYRLDDGIIDLLENLFK